MPTSGAHAQCHHCTKTGMHFYTVLQGNKKEPYMAELGKPLALFPISSLSTSQWKYKSVPQTQIPDLHLFT